MTFAPSGQSWPKGREPRLLPGKTPAHGVAGVLALSAAVSALMYSSV